MKKKPVRKHGVRTGRKRDLTTELKDALPALVAGGVVVFDRDTVASLATDWTKLPSGAAIAGAFPKSTEDVRQILAACHELDIAVVPSGGRTGLSGGAVASDGCVSLSFSKMNHIHEVDPLSRTIKVQAGAVTEDVHEHCARQGLTWPIDLASKGSCTIGGNLSTNAGGVRVVRYGMARRWVTGARVVTMQGEVLDLCEGLEKDNVGYNLLQLILGSEGTLALITEATLKLVPVPDSRQRRVFLFSVANLNQLYELYQSVRDQRLDVGAFEFFSDKCMKAVEEKSGKACPLQNRGEFYVLLEAQSDTDRADWLEILLDRKIVQDGTRADTGEQVRTLWALREHITESLGRTAMLRKFDLSLPFHRQVEFLERMESRVAEEGWKLDLYFFGHFGDGSPHINVLKPGEINEKRFLDDFAKFEAALVEALLEFRGSQSAEHGVGIIRREWLKVRRSETEQGLYKAIKAAFDPKGLLNPGKVI